MKTHAKQCTECIDRGKDIWSQMESTGEKGTEKYSVGKEIKLANSSEKRNITLKKTQPNRSKPIPKFTTATESNRRLLLKVIDDWMEILDTGGNIDIIYMDFMNDFDKVHGRH